MKRHSRKEDTGKARDHMQTCSRFPVNRHRQVKTTRGRHHHRNGSNFSCHVGSQVVPSVWLTVCPTSVLHLQLSTQHTQIPTVFGSSLNCIWAGQRLEPGATLVDHSYSPCRPGTGVGEVAPWLPPVVPWGKLDRGGRVKNEGEPGSFKGVKSERDRGRAKRAEEFSSSLNGGGGVGGQSQE